LLFGARGAVPATANIAPAILVEIYEAFVRGDHAASKAAQLKLNPIRLSLTLGTAPGGVKAALAIMGLAIGPSRSPVGPPNGEEEKVVGGGLEQGGILGGKGEAGRSPASKNPPQMGFRALPTRRKKAPGNGEGWG